MIRPCIFISQEIASYEIKKTLRVMLDWREVENCRKRLRPVRECAKAQAFLLMRLSIQSMNGYRFCMGQGIKYDKYQRGS